MMPLESFDKDKEPAKWLTYPFASTSEPGVIWVYQYNPETGEVDAIKPCKGFRFHDGQCCHVEAILQGNRKIKRTKLQIQEAIKEYRKEHPIPKYIQGVRRTSLEAYFNNRLELNEKAHKVLQYLIKAGAHGSADVDTAEALKMYPSTVSARRNDLKAMGLIEEASHGKSIKTERSAILWRAIAALRDPDRGKEGRS